MEVPEAQAQPGEAERPEWLPEKFTSPEEMARSYGEAEQRLVQLQAEVDRQRSEFSEALTNLEGLTSQPQAPQFNPQTDPLLQQYQIALDNGDAQALLAINLELNRQIMRQEMEEVRKEFGGRIDRSTESDREVAITLATERVARNFENWDDLAPKIGAFLQERPHWIPENASVEAFEKTLNEAARVITAEEILSERQNEDRDRQAKLAAAGLQGNGAGGLRSPEEAAAEWDRIKQINLGGYSGILGQR